MKINLQKLKKICSLAVLVSSVGANITAQTFNFTGAVQNYTVPPLCTVINVTVSGAQGGGSGGLGARYTSSMAVTPGQVLQIYVGGAGTNTSVVNVGGFNGGGGEFGNFGNEGSGGGATDIRVAPYALANRMIVAGGGGGQGGYAGGAGGNGGLLGATGGAGQPPCTGGNGGTASSGGTGGLPNGACGAGSAGVLGIGGAGGSCSYGGGGGGGGYYGGGGGGSDSDPCCADAAGGGGGSSFCFYAGGVCTDGVKSGNGEVIIQAIIPGGAALNFDGLNDRVNLGSSITTSLVGGNRLSVEAWVRTTNASNLGNLVSNYNTTIPSSLGFLLRRANTGVNGNFEFFVGNGPTFVSVNTPANTNTLNVWTHVAGTWDGSVLRFYINGVLSATASSAPVTNFAAGGEVWIGGSNTNEFNTGDIDEVRIWNRTLCQGEIQNNMMGQLSVPQSSLLAYYQFNQGLASFANPTVTSLTPLAGPTGTLVGPFNLNGATSNWVTPGGVSSTSTVTPFVTPTLAIASPTAICSGSSTTLTASGVSSYTWTSGPTTATFAVTPSVTTTYSVVGAATNGCLTNVTTRTINVNTTPTVAINNNTVCGTGPIGALSTTVTGTGPYTYAWNTGATTASISGLTAGAYTSTVTASNGCFSSGSANVISNPVPTVAVNNGTICSGSTFTMVPTGASTYTIQGGSAAVSPNANANYTVVGTSTAGCVSANTATSNVTVNAVPTITVNSGAICSGNSFTITPSGASTYTYSGGSAVVSPTATAAYTVTGTNTVGCNGSAVSNVTVNAAPIITVNSGAICSGNSFTITPSGASTYTFSGGSAVVSPTATAAYTVTGTNTVNTCVGSAVSNVTVNANPIVNAVSTETNFICVGSSATLTASGASSYVWNTTATTAVIAVSPTTTTSYTVTGTNAAGCSANAVISQSVSTCTDIKNSSFNSSNLSFLVYPNPSNGIFNVQLESAATIEVTDVLGRVILTDNVNAGTYKLNLGNNVNGVYFVKATVDGKTKTVKIVKD